MKKAILATKVGMTQLFLADGRVAPVTVVQAGPVTVIQKKTVARDGYEAVQVGYKEIIGEKKQDKVIKPLKGHFAAAGQKPTRVLREFRFDDCASYNVGDTISCDVFAQGDKIDVVGKSKGKGFTGVIARWNQHRGPMKHGSKYHRGVGSMSANSTPSRVFKNKHMSGHMGAVRVTVQNLDVVRVDAERNLMFIKGAVPGPNGGLLLIRDTVKA